MTHRRHWTEQENALLAAMYPHCHTEDVAAWIGRTVGQCYQHAYGLGLHKSDEYLASDCAGRMDARRAEHPSMVASRFKSGQPAWNKGTKGVVGVQEACRATQFKKGRPASEARNYVPIGSYRICADGYLERKLTDDPSILPARRWVAVHRLVWEAAHGPIPAGHVVCFKPGQKTTALEEVTADRLECITRGQLAQRNHPRARSPELAKLVQLKGAITRQVNRITREAQEQTA
jgi:HNH endonuclease